jgi:hypothetical protein
MLGRLVLTALVSQSLRGPNYWVGPSEDFFERAAAMSGATAAPAATQLALAEIHSGVVVAPTSIQSISTR